LPHQLGAGAPARAMLMINAHSGSPRGASSAPERLIHEIITIFRDYLYIFMAP
jgi:hypothetical protein